jgi:molecular chaperone DnaK
VKKSLGEYGDKIDAAEKERIESALKDVEAALNSDDKADIEAKTEALVKASQKLGEKMYEQQAQAGQAPGAGNGGAAPQPEAATETQAADDNVVDAEFKEVKDRK